MLPTYKNLDDLKEKIDYWLSHDIERTKLQLEMFDFTRNNYTYKIRCQQIMKIIKKTHNEKSRFTRKGVK